MIKKRVKKKNTTLNFFTGIFFLLVLICGCFKNQNNALTNEKNHPVTPEEYTAVPGLHYKEMFLSHGAIKTYIIGESVNGNPLLVTEIGTGNKTGLVITGAIHGNEKNTNTVARTLEAKYIKDGEFVPPHTRLFFLPIINPDGLVKRTRRNARNVDLNRNFPTDDWIPDAVSPSRIVKGCGGTSPGSEPEVKAVTGWLEKRVKQVVERTYLISFHSAYPPTGSVQPGYLEYGKPGPESKRFAAFISEKAGYKYLNRWITSLPITGEFIHWCEINDIWACDIELPDYRPPSTIPANKNETTNAVIERVVRELLYRFFIDTDN